MLDSLTGGLISDAVVVAVLGLTICGIALTGLAWLGCMALDHVLRLLLAILMLTA